MHKIGYVLPAGFQVMALATQAVFEFANVVAGEPFYEVACHSMPGGSVKASLGMALQTRPFTARSTADTWMVVGVLDPLATPSPSDLLHALRKCSARARRTVGLCTGAFVLAEAGLLAGRRATTHWAYADALQQRHPNIQVEPDRIFIADDPIWTSAGMTAELDLALGLVEKDLGDDVARAVAHRLVTPAPLGRPVPAFGNPEPRTALGPHRAGARACPQPSGAAAERGRTRCGRKPQPAPVQPCVHGRDRPVASQGGRASARGGSALDDRAQPPSAGGGCARNGFSRSPPSSRGVHAWLRQAAPSTPARRTGGILKRVEKTTAVRHAPIKRHRWPWPSTLTAARHVPRGPLLLGVPRVAHAQMPNFFSRYAIVARLIPSSRAADATLPPALCSACRSSCSSA